MIAIDITTGPLQGASFVCVDAASADLIYGAGAWALSVVQPSAAPLVPVSVTMRQARTALLAAGLYANIPAILDALPEPQKSAAKIEWEYSGEVQRNRPLVNQLGQALGLNSSQLDALFITAAGL
ncbi:MAG: hypothetical protein ACRCV9_07090 [Burkholderiaceae bacterium]